MATPDAELAGIVVGSSVVKRVLAPFRKKIPPGRHMPDGLL